MSRHRMSQDSTIYQYTLVGKIPFSDIFNVLYFTVLLLFPVMEILLSGWSQLISFLLGFGLVQVLHLFIIRAMLSIQPESEASSWSLQFRPPWIGVLPKQFCSVGLFQRVHVQLLWIGLAFIGCLVPWTSAAFLCTLVYIHVWILLPRLLILMMRKENSAIVKLGERDVSYYKP